MKYALIALLVVINPFGASAQKDVFWGDGGMSLARGLPGASMTYNYNVIRFLGLGAGAQIYDFHATMTNFQPIPTIFWDLRFNIRSRKKSQYFVFLDAGLNIYKRNTDTWADGDNIDYVRYDNGSYTGLGIGYFQRQTNRGWGRYVTLKMISNSYHAYAFNKVSGESSDERWGDDTIVISFGFKF
jgi:hypothetical protein